MRYQLYKYEKEEVKLEFSFADGEKNADQKAIFLELLKCAIVDLSMELNLDNKI